VIDVRVGQEDRVERRWIERQLRPVPLTELLEPLEESAVDEEPGTLRLNQVT
jgi:hypothetical protein